MTRQLEYNTKALDIIERCGLPVDRGKVRKLSYICRLIFKSRNMVIRKRNKHSGYYNLIIRNFVDKNIINQETSGSFYYNKKQTEDYQSKTRRFYASNKWRELRYEVLKEQNGVCQLCGRGRKDGVVLHVDHIVPLSKCWERRLDKTNLQVLCEDCNLGKINKDSIDWR